MENQLKVNFSFTDEHNQTTTINKTVNECVLECYDGTMSFLLDQFKEFLLGSGFSETNVNAITIVEQQD